MGPNRGLKPTGIPYNSDFRNHKHNKINVACVNLTHLLAKKQTVYVYIQRRFSQANVNQTLCLFVLQPSKYVNGLTCL